MRRGRRRARAPLCLPLAAAILAPVLVPALATTATASTTRAPQAGSVQMRITDVSMSVPARSTTRRPLQFRVTLTNTSGQTLSKVRIQGFRGDPLGSQTQLDSSLADRTPPTDGYPIAASNRVFVDLPAGATVASTFTTTISILNDGKGLCQCRNAVYPVYLTATSAVTGSTILGSSATYVPSQLDAATKTKVAWVWPLIDRPHRLVGDTVFTDDDLASLVSGGRLDRALQVVEGVSASIPMTLVVDPELLDELQVMSTGKYTIRTTTGSVAGAGQSAARSWLDRLAALLVTHPAIHVSLTPYADPDVQSLTRAGLTWATYLPTSMQTRVNTALQGRATATDVAWPASGGLGHKALDATAAAGATTVVLDGGSVSPSTTNGEPTALATLQTGGGRVTAAVTTPAMQRMVAQAVSTEAPATTGATVLPSLIAETTIRSIQAGARPTYAVLTAPRYVDPNPARAIRAIDDTSSSAYASPTDVRALTADRPSRTSKLRTIASSSESHGLPPRNLASNALASRSQSAIGSLLARDATGASVVPGIARATQRVSSSAWRPLDGSPFPTTVAAAYADGLRNQVRRFLDGVRIAPPSSGSYSYTLGSKDSDLPITVENTLPYRVVVQLDVAAEDGLYGYEMGSVEPQSVAANSKQTVRVPSKLNRSGRIPVEARLETPSGRKLGEPVLIYVRSTVFGLIGVVITAVAGGVLVIALVVRLGRQLARRRRKADRATRAGRTDRPAGTAGTATT